MKSLDYTTALFFGSEEKKKKTRDMFDSRPVIELIQSRNSPRHWLTGYFGLHLSVIAVYSPV